MKKKKIIVSIIISAILLVIVIFVLQNFLSSKKYAINLNNSKREYLLHLPKDYKSGNKYPLVIALHGYTDNPRLMEFYSGLSRKSDKEKFIIVYPYGTKNNTDKNLSWNGGSCCGNGVLNNVDDVGFINSLTDELLDKYNIDSSKVYLLGFSNGALLSYRIAAETPEKFKAVAIVSGSIGGKVYKKLPAYKIQNPKMPISILIMHGINDKRISYFGGENEKKDGSFISFKESVNFWKANNKCKNLIFLDDLKVIRRSHTNCEDNFRTEEYSVKNSGHIWPGGMFDLPKNLRDQSISATDIIWDFFNQ